MTLRELARELRLSPAYVSDLENGRRQWTLPRVLRFMDAINAR